MHLSKHFGTSIVSQEKACFSFSKKPWIYAQVSGKSMKGKRLPD